MFMLRHIVTCDIQICLKTIFSLPLPFCKYFVLQKQIYGLQLKLTFSTLSSRLMWNSILFGVWYRWIQKSKTFACHTSQHVTIWDNVKYCGLFWPWDWNLPMISNTYKWRWHLLRQLHYVQQIVPDGRRIITHHGE